MVQQVLKVLFRGLHIILRQGFIPQANFFSHVRAPLSKRWACLGSVANYRKQES